MTKHKYVLLVILTFFSISLYPNSTLQDEVIRRKIENILVFKTLNNDYQIYCIPAIREVYLINNFNPYWNDENKVNDLIDAIKNCAADGLNPNDYHLLDIYELKNGTTSDEKANFDIVLSDAFILYLSHLLSGKVNPQTIDAEWHVMKTDQDPFKYFYEADSIGVKRVISNVEPKNENYDLLKKELEYYRQLSVKQQPEIIPPGQIIKPGMSDARIPLIRKCLAFNSGLNLPDTVLSSLYDDDLKAKIIDFQELYGLEALGNIGNQTIEAMNVPVTEKIKTIEANLERLRWLPQELPNYYLMVNIVNFELHAVEDNQIIRKHKVVVGKPYRMTPVFSATMQYLVFNPTWTVPPTILKEDLIPEIRKDKQTLANKNIKVYDNQGNQINADSIDWLSNKVFSYTYRQDAGKSNALGVVKFMFPNPYNVYLHDTPSKELFERTERAFSSGCIRVQKPLELAVYLLRNQPQYDIKHITKIIESGATQTVILKNRPEVYLLYLTAWIDDNGRLNFRKDIYNRDKKLIEALASKPVYDL